MKNFLLVFALAIPLCADTVSVECIGMGQDILNTGVDTAQCNAGNSAISSGQIIGLSLFGNLFVNSLGQGSSSLTESFNETFTVPTIISWGLDMDFGGPWGSVIYDFGGNYYGFCGLQGGVPQCQNTSNNWTETVSLEFDPGTYSFSATSYVSDQGSVVFSAGDPGMAEAPEPGSFFSVSGAFFAISLLMSKIGRRRPRP